MGILFLISIFIYLRYFCCLLNYILPYRGWWAAMGSRRAHYRQLQANQKLNEAGGY